MGNTKNAWETCSREHTVQYIVPTLKERRPSSAVGITVCLFCRLPEALEQSAGLRWRRRCSRLEGDAPVVGASLAELLHRKCCSQSFVSNSGEMHRPQSEVWSIGQSTHAAPEFVTPQIVINGVEEQSFRDPFVAHSIRLDPRRRQSTERRWKTLESWDVRLNKNRRMDLRTRGRVSGFVPNQRPESSVIGKLSGWFKKKRPQSRCW